MDNKAMLEHGDKLAPRFDADGLITAVAQDHESGEILMLAHMNQQALDETLQTGVAHFWSRSRKKLWKKGETSGNTLQVRQVRIDCDQDAVVLLVSLDGTGACHTGARSCFYRAVETQAGAHKLVRLSETNG